MPSTRKKIINILRAFLIIIGLGSVNAQSQHDLLSGQISFVSSKNVYVKFPSTKSIHIGDTLFLNINNQKEAALIVTNKSSSSCVCTPLSDIKFSLGQLIVSNREQVISKAPEREKLHEEGPVYKIEETAAVRKDSTKRKQDIFRGRISIATYSNYSESSQKPAYRFNYTFSLTGTRVNNSNLSFDSYISFRHRTNEWYKVQENINNALKIYTLALQYSFGKSMDAFIGRRVNYRIASMGAIDGIQFEKRIKHFVFGTVLGSRPDLNDYSLNFKLLEYGAYAGHHITRTNGFNFENTAALINQMSHGNTDRRFIHIQHVSTLFRNLSIFGSSELDIFKKINNQGSNTFRLTNLYVTARYRFSKKLNISGSYDARNNVIYYETYKNDIDRLLEEETRQGFRLQLNYQIWRFISLGCSGNLRMQQSGKNESKNYNAYLNYSRLPLLNAALNLNTSFLQTSYLKSYVSGASLSKDFLKGRFYSELYMRYIKYQYNSFEYAFNQKIAGVSLSYRLNKNSSLAVYSEKTFDNQSNNLLMNARIMIRF